MSRDDIIRQIRKLDLEHRDDGDGGYLLLKDMRKYRSQLSGEEDEIMQDVLLQLVEDQDKTFFGVALESLVQEWGNKVAEQLARILDRCHLELEWEGDVLLALLRLEHGSIEKRSVAHISQRLSSGDNTALPLVAALSRVSADQCMAIASTTILNELALGHGEDLEGYLPAFVRNFLDVDANLLYRLVRTVNERNEKVGRALASMLIRYLDRTYVQKDLGVENISMLKELIATALN